MVLACMLSLVSTADGQDLTTYYLTHYLRDTIESGQETMAFSVLLKEDENEQGILELIALEFKDRKELVVGRHTPTVPVYINGERRRLGITQVAERMQLKLLEEKSETEFTSQINKDYNYIHLSPREARRMKQASQSIVRRMEAITDKRRIKDQTMTVNFKINERIMLQIREGEYDNRNRRVSIWIDDFRFVLKTDDLQEALTRFLQTGVGE